MYRLEPWRDSLQKKLELDFVPDTITTWQLLVLNFPAFFRVLFPSLPSSPGPPEIDDEWLPHVTLGKLQASKAQLGGVTVAALEEFAPKLPIMVQGLTLLGTRPKQLWLDWATWALGDAGVGYVGIAYGLHHFIHIST